MKILNPRPPFIVIIIIIILAISQLSSCRYVPKTTTDDQETQQTDTTEIHTKFSRHFPAKAPEASRKEVANPVYGVSYRAVPGGPNPLHNWSIFLPSCKRIFLQYIVQNFSFLFFFFLFSFCLSSQRCVIDTEGKVANLYHSFWRVVILFLFECFWKIICNMFQHLHQRMKFNHVNNWCMIW